MHILFVASLLPDDGQSKLFFRFVSFPLSMPEELTNCLQLIDKRSIDVRLYVRRHWALEFRRESKFVVSHGQKE